MFSLTKKLFGQISSSIAARETNVHVENHKIGQFSDM